MFPYGEKIIETETEITQKKQVFNEKIKKIYYNTCLFLTYKNTLISRRGIESVNACE